MDKIYTCKICSATSDMVEFYEGVTNRCKECHKEKVRQNRVDNSDYYRAYDAKRFRDDPNVRERHRRYQATEGGRASMRRAQEKWIDGNQDKRAAHNLLNSAVKSGRVRKPDKCSKCGEGGRIEGHHTDYTKPLDVMWLCRQCHVNEHK